MRLPILLLVPMLCFAACGDDAPTSPTPPSDEVFLFDSGGAHHIQGYGAWQVTAHRTGAFHVTHQTGDSVKEFDAVTLADDDRDGLWAAIDAAGLADVEVEERPGVPDESTVAFGLERGGKSVAKLELWQNDLAQVPALTPLLERLRTLIEKHSGEKPVF